MAGKRKKVPHEAYVDATVVLKYTPSAYGREDAEYLAEEAAEKYLTGLHDAGEIEDFEITGVVAEPEVEKEEEEQEERRDEIDELIEKEDADDDGDYN